MDCICINELNRLVIVEKISPSATPDGSGNIDETNDTNWVRCGSEWVKFVTRGSREFYRDRQVGEEVTHQVWMQFSDAAGEYRSGMRLRMDGRKFNISAPPINVDEKDEWLLVQTKEVPTP